MDTIFVEVDVQVDFVDPRGALYVPGSDRVLPNIQRLLAHAAQRRLTLLSSMDAHLVDDPEFTQYPPHCIAGTPGQRRYFDTLPGVPPRVWAADARVTAADLRLVAGQHYIAEKRAFPMFTNPWVSALRANGVFRDQACVAFGVAADVCVRANVLDLCAAGARVQVVGDAIAGLDTDATARALDEMRAAGARLVTTDAVVR